MTEHQQPTTKQEPIPDPIAQSPESERGFLLPTLFTADTALTGRWDYLTDCWEAGKLPDAPIPPIHFGSADKTVMKMLSASLDAIPKYGSWQGWSSSTNFRFFLEWILHGLHHAGHPMPPVEPAGCEGANERLRQVFGLALMMKSPCDYFGDLLSESAYGKRQGFFPTPHHLCELMTRLTIGFEDRGYGSNCVASLQCLLAMSRRSEREFAVL